MNKEQFQALIQAITKRDFIILTDDITLQFEKEYRIQRVLPITQTPIYFYWKTPKNTDKFLRSFITSFTSKYREPNPKTYDYTYGDKKYFWADKTAKDIECCYYHHASHMFNKAQLMEQIAENFNSPDIESAFCKYGFYHTEYGIGIFVFWQTQYITNAINKLATYLKSKSIAFTNEYSDARWVLRFKIGISKDIHNNIINKFNYDISHS